MLRPFLILPIAFICAALPALCQQGNRPAALQIIPQPLSVAVRDGYFFLKADTRIYFPDGKADWETAAQYIGVLAKAPTGFDLKTEAYAKAPDQIQNNTIYFLPDNTIQGEEGYKLDIQPEHIRIRARSAKGAFYAVQTLRQLFPASFNTPAPEPYAEWLAPCCTIEDAPRFQYRGLHLDVGRHFFPVPFIKRYIDLLAMHKLNTFHWHLTEDQGWRIEIKKYPKLQTVASCRKETLVGRKYDQTTATFDGKEYCGFYTQEEIKDVVEYARRRFVNIIPEIEMPGHAQAALSAYPELGCTGGPYEAATSWGVFPEVFCAGNEQTFEFIDNVLKEVCALFPGPYVHIGGDECPKDRWKACPKCQKRMKAEGLKDEHELQSYFIQRAEKMLAKQGKKLIGWDEILEGGLAPTATVMSWRGIEGGIAAAKQHHDVIMTPGEYCYFDHYQGDPETEPLAIGGYTTLEKVYAYEPIPAELSAEEAKYILGTQANVWTEYMETSEYVEYMVFPRLCAMAEVAWTAKELKNWPGFITRLRNHLSRLDLMKVNYSKAHLDVVPAYTAGKVSLKIADPMMQIHYTTDGTEPEAPSAVFSTPFALKESATVKAAAFVGRQKTGKTTTVQYLVHKAAGKPYTMSNQADKYTGDGAYALTNGVMGSTKNRNAWLGLSEREIDPVIDLGAPTEFKRVTIHYLNDKTSWIYPPRSAELLVSEDGKIFTSLDKKDIDADKMTGLSIGMVAFDLSAGKAHYLKIVLKPYGIIPDGAAGAGNGAWLFADEVIVE